MFLYRLFVASLFAALFHSFAWSADPPPPACTGSEPYQLTVQASKDGGVTWVSNWMKIRGYSGMEYPIMVRTLMTITTGQTDGWSFSLKHDPSYLQAQGGDLTLNSVTIDGTHTATVQNGNPPDFDVTAIASPSTGFTQGILIDFNQHWELGPTSNFVTAAACYTLTIPTNLVAGSTATVEFTSDLGEPPAQALIAQGGNTVDPCANNFTLQIYYGTLTPSQCNNNWLSGRVGESLSSDEPQGPPALLQATVPSRPFSCADANGDNDLNISDPIFVLTHLFLGGPAPAVVDTSMVLKTNQTKCYDDSIEMTPCPKPEESGYGQDGTYYEQIGLERRYEVIDPIPPATGKVIKDHSTGLMWEQSPAAGEFAWHNPDQDPDADEVAANRTTGGYLKGSWRLPTVGEMLSICDLSKGFDDDFALPQEFGPFPAGFPRAVWTSTVYAVQAGRAWLVEISPDKNQQNQKDWLVGATTSADEYGGKHGVMAVRTFRQDITSGDPAPIMPNLILGDFDLSGNLNITDAINILAHLFLGGPPPCFVGRPVVPESYPPERFVDNHDGTITDTVTMLMWGQDPNTNPAGFGWVAAVDYCDALEFPEGSGITDWRLPNVFELATLINFADATPPVFPDAFNLSSGDVTRLWASTTSAGFTYRAWSIAHNSQAGAAGGVVGDGRYGSPQFGEKSTGTWFLYVRGPD